jgi:hypothetical protein
VLLTANSCLYTQYVYAHRQGSTEADNKLSPRKSSRVVGWSVVRLEAEQWALMDTMTRRQLFSQTDRSSTNLCATQFHTCCKRKLLYPSSHFLWTVDLLLVVGHFLSALCLIGWLNVFCTLTVNQRCLAYFHRGFHSGSIVAYNQHYLTGTLYVHRSKQGLCRVWLVN